MSDLIVADFDGDQLLDLGVLDSLVGTISLIRNTTGNPPVLSVEAANIVEESGTYLVTFQVGPPRFRVCGSQLTSCSPAPRL